MSVYCAPSADVCGSQPRKYPWRAGDGLLEGRRVSTAPCGQPVTGCMPRLSKSRRAVRASLPLLALWIGAAQAESYFNDATVDIWSSGVRPNKTCGATIKPVRSLGDSDAPQLVFSTTVNSVWSFAIANEAKYQTPVLVQNNLRIPFERSVGLTLEQFIATRNGRALKSKRPFFVTAKLDGRFVSSRYDNLDFNWITEKLAESCSAEKVAAESEPLSGSFRPISNYATRLNRDIFGEDITLPDGRIWIESADLDICAARCEGLSACLGFSFDRWTRKCYFKKNITNSILDPRSTIAVKKPTQIPSVSTEPFAVQIVRNRHLIGSPILRRKAKDISSCRQICVDELKCVAFSFNKRSELKDKCEIFSQSDGTTEDAAFDSGYKYQER
jgi:PAN domain-containing protein